MSTKINRVYKPTIHLDKLQIKNTESNLSQNPDKITDQVYLKSRMIGDISPLIVIEGYHFSFNHIMYMELYTNKFLPRIKVTLLDTAGAFGESYIPKQKPIMQVYIRSKNNNILPIRNDYIITSMRSVPDSNYDKSSSNLHTRYILEGELFVPGLKDSKIQSYEGTSFDVLQTITKELKLGFATNIESTNDEMIWINDDPNVEEFIKTHINDHSYIDEQSFMNTFVDVYYNVNFINLFPMINEDAEIEDTYNMFSQYTDYLKDNDSEQDELSHKLILTNWSNLKETPMYIVSYNPISKHGKILTTKGNIRKLQYYNSLNDEEDLKNNFLEFNPSTYSILNVDDKDENLKHISNKTSYQYDGIDYNNTHEHYKFAKILNETGMSELNKITIEVVLYGLNLTVVKNMQIPVVIINETDSAEIKKAIYNTQENSKYAELYKKYGFIIDTNYTGKYIIKDISYIYNPFDKKSNIFMTKLTLAKSDWKPSPQLMDLKK